MSLFSDQPTRAVTASTILQICGRLFGAVIVSVVLAGCDRSGAMGMLSDGFQSFENTGEDCANFLIIAPVTPDAARRHVPEPFEPVSPPLAFVEMADCAGGSINGVPTGPFRISEAAVFIRPPGGGPGMDIYTLWQVDTLPQLSALKINAGFPGGVVPGIRLEPGLIDATAEVPYPLSPYSLAATLTAVSVPGPALLNELWHLGPRGVVHTTNDIFQTDAIRAGVGQITLQPDTVLADLFGGTTVVGAAAQGRGTFRNFTRLEPELTPASP